jgi:sulfur-oxidizing protein SoxA
MQDLVAFIANKSNGMKYQPQLSHPKEQEMLAVGEALFYRAAAVRISPAPPAMAKAASASACRACRTSPSRARTRRKPWAAWPTYRVSQSQLRTMQHRLWDCYRQMRHPIPEYGSDGVTALTVYMVKMAKAVRSPFRRSSAEGGEP